MLSITRSLLTLALVLAPWSADFVRADEYVDQLNEIAIARPGTVAAQETLFPALEKMSAPPMPMAFGPELDELLMLSPGDPLWGQLQRWARKEEQQAVVEAIRSAVEDESGDPILLSVPFGVDDSESRWVDAGLYIELKQDDLLITAEYHYLDKMRWANGLMLFLGMQHASDGEGREALQTLVDLLNLGRIMAERPSIDEVEFAYNMMRMASERTRDVVYTHTDAFSSEDLVEFGESFDLRTLRSRSMPLPSAERIKALQVLDRTFTDRGPVRPVEFARVFSIAESGGRPLRRLSAAASWRDAAIEQGDWFDQMDAIDQVFGDFNKRWLVPGYRDPLLEQIKIYDRTNPRQARLVRAMAAPIYHIVEKRDYLEMDLGGTLNALGIMAFRKAEGQFPPRISAIEPEYTNRLFPDFWNPNTSVPGNVFRDMAYWVPMRDQEWDRRERPVPYELSIGYPAPGESLFQLLPDVRRPLNIDPTIGIDVDNLRLEELEGFESFDPAAMDASGPDMGSFGGMPIGGLGLDSEIEARIMGAIDFDTFTADVPALRQALLDAVRAGALDSSDPAELEDMLRQLNELGMTRSNAAEKVRAYFSGEQEGAAAEEMAQAQMMLMMMGIDMAQAERVAILAAERFMAIPMTEELMDKVGSGGRISAAESVEFANAIIEALVVEDVVNPAMELARGFLGAMESMAGAFGGGDVSGFGGGSFTASVDDTNFLLYSRGPDGLNDRAAFVGAGGMDILLWPPLMSLAREAGASSGAGSSFFP